ncbi:hypothetical protein [Acinetobacter sp.]|uniref:hypothetical protein n=1 Tax=Acinetobacter sp. TaxID=472 RepID=UPI0035B2C291
MIKDGSILLNIPKNLDYKQAVFFDGMRHALEIIDFSYKRLYQELTKLSKLTQYQKNYTHVYVDMWAVIDAIDRFRCLWIMQANSIAIPSPYSTEEINGSLQQVRNIRNVSSHMAQKIDQIIALNSSVSGSISWVSVKNIQPLNIHTFVVRSGIINGKVSFQFSIPKEKINFIEGTGNIIIELGAYTINLSQAYEYVCGVSSYIDEQWSLQKERLLSLNEPFPHDVFASAELNLTK